MSRIEWTERTWNPWTGCTKISPGCDNCYMFRDYPRLRDMHNPSYRDTPETVRVINSQLDRPLSWTKPVMVFVCSMSDYFHPAVPDEVRYRTFLNMTRSAEKRGHTFQLLTKRPGLAVAFWERHKDELKTWHPNIWLGTSVENQKYAPRLTVLARVPAPVKFVSAEPLIGPVDLTPWLEAEEVDWIIVGGESGPDARDMKAEWARHLRHQARKYGAAFFLKQLGGAGDKRGGAKAILDGKIHHGMPTPSQR